MNSTTTDPIAPEPDQTPSPGWPRLIWPMVTGGFLAATLAWIAWFITHLPALDLPAAATGPILLASLVIGLGVCGAWAGRRLGWRVGLGAGLVASLLNLLILGAFLAEPSQPPDAANGSDAAGADLRPNAALIATGFILLGAAAGLVGGTLGGVLRGARAPSEALDPQRWLGRFGWVAAGGTLPLILLGGLVTSSESGLAVPDWPSSYGANMFLYPIALMADPRIFLEHTHRLFGSLVGLSVLALMLNALSVEPRRWVKAWAIALFVLVVAQGVMGGIRVVEQHTGLGLAHGVTGQIFFALLIAQAWWLGPTWVRAHTERIARLRRLKRFATGFLHATVLQLILGAAFRHLSAGETGGAAHALWTHAAFSLVVVIFAVLTAAGAMTDPPEEDPRRGVLRRIGQGAAALVFIQFALGWMALVAVLPSMERGPLPTAERLDQAEAVPLSEVLLATAHQANGALVLAVAMSAYVWALRGSRAAPEAQPVPDEPAGSLQPA